MATAKPHALHRADREAPERRAAALARERDAALADAADARERAAAAMRQCDSLASEILSERRRHARDLAREREAHAAAIARANRHCEELAHHLTHARETIRNMERSRFWKLRLVWVRIRTRFR